MFHVKSNENLVLEWHNKIKVNEIKIHTKTGQSFASTIMSCNPSDEGLRFVYVGTMTLDCSKPWGF